jgi:hypothetical protein
MLGLEVGMFRIFKDEVHADSNKRIWEMDFTFDERTGLQE